MSTLLTILGWLVSLGVLYVFVTGLGLLAYKTRESLWGLVLIFVLPSIIAGCLFILEAGWKMILIPSVIALGIMALGRIGILLRPGSSFGNED